MIDLISTHGATYGFRPAQYTDLHALHALYHHPEMMPWLPQSFTSGRLMGTAWILNELLRQSIHPKGAFYAIVDAHDTLIGACALEAYVEEHARYEIAFELHPDFQRQGIMKAAVLRMLQIAFSEYPCNRLDAYTLVNNIASQKLLLSTGFKQEGILKQFRKFREQYHDIILFGLTREQWQNSL